MDQPYADRLLERAQAGDADAFLLLIQEYEQRIYALCCRLTRDRELARDLAQEVCVEAFRSIRRYRGEAAFYTWLYRLAVNRWLKTLRERKRYAEEISPNRPGNEPSPETTLEAQELREAVHHALLTATSPREYTAIVLRYHEGLPLEEVARLCRCSTQAAATRISRGIARIRKRIGIPDEKNM